ncbi:NUDIX hydrolase [Hespellia stercorisuis]|nr:NUDIX hydrolase [Hespellia stercorisuis]
MEERAKRIDRKLKCKGNIVNLYDDTIQLPTGEIVHYDFLNHNGATAVVPVMDDGRILMVRQFRNAIDRETLEIPAGKLDDIEESGMDCAKRELEEETGYKSDHLELLITLRTWLAFCNEKIEVFVATNLIVSHQNLDEDEFIDVCAYTMEELEKKIFDGEIEDAKTIAALMAYKSKYR